ncbi:MAG: hypothetical protein Q8R28_14910 [Dehalococcoidia bacterium]|nr:hypothetical protein [Dehalococcoidia bacterium]
MINGPKQEEVSFPDREWGIQAIKSFLETHTSSGDKLVDATAIYNHLWGNWAMIYNLPKRTKR